ncbi:MAG: hypothetical protein K2Y21_14830 [Phycisphaerales bacterium]|nr:hypothetical protein [Phycisphaerales bacterium]
MSNLSPQLLDDLDRYLDGGMSAAEVAGFERALESSPQLRAALDEARSWQGDIDASLRAQFSAAALDLKASKRTTARNAGGGDSAITAPPRTLRFPKWLPLAAAAAIGCAGLLSVYFISGSRPGGVVATVRPTLAALYNSTVDTGFKPEEVCTTRDKFAEWLGTKFGVSLAPREERSDITLVGWSYSTAISPYTGVLLAKSGDLPIIVALDLKVRESGKGPPAVGELVAHNKALHVHKAVIDGVAFYEVSPLDTPRIIDNLGPHAPGK